jgi:uncharacterized membrane protein YraQ (UPF0718 family)
LLIKDWKKFALLAGAALSLPGILIINRIIGRKKTFVFCSLMLGMSTIVGFQFGMMHQEGYVT